MRFLFCFLLALSSAGYLHAQAPITHDDFRSLIPFVEKEDYKSTFQQTKHLLETKSNDSSDLRGIVIYMHLLSAAGMVSQQQMSYRDFSKDADKYVGQWLVMPGHPCKDSTEQAFNSLQFKNDNGPEGYTIATNNAATSILFFEYYRYEDAVNPADFRGKNVRCGGFLKSVESNPNESAIWIARLHIAHAVIHAVQ